MERARGVEPPLMAWEAIVEPFNYARMSFPYTPGVHRMSSEPPGRRVPVGSPLHSVFFLTLSHAYQAPACPSVPNSRSSATKPCRVRGGIIWTGLVSAVRTGGR